MRKLATGPSLSSADKGDRCGRFAWVSGRFELFSPIWQSVKKNPRGCNVVDFPLCGKGVRGPEEEHEGNLDDDDVMPSGTVLSARLKDSHQQ